MTDFPPSPAPRLLRAGVRAAVFAAALAAVPGSADPAAAPGAVPPASLTVSAGTPARDVLAGLFAAGRLSPDEVGLIALPVAGGAPLLEWNAARAYNPASTMKLVTSYAALALLGPDYRWRTALHLDGAIEDGVLRGNLVLRGGGDPKLVIEDLTELIARMRAAGLREIGGDLLLDDALYDLSAESLRALDGDVSQPYNVAPNAALLNFKAIRFVMVPKGAGATVALDPALADVEILNELRSQAGPCGNGGAVTIRDAGDERRAVIRVSGTIRTACGEQSTSAAVLTPRQFARAFFKAAWVADGGTWRGDVRIVPGAARGVPWLVWESPRTLADVVQDIHKLSNNVMTRQVMLQLAAETLRLPATMERARGVVRKWLDLQGLSFPELVLDNGSGLSRDERISARSLARLLGHAAAGPNAELMRTTLPSVGIDGTMKRRLVGEGISGRAWVKTGSLEGVRAIAGYVDARSGQRYAVVMLVNGPGAAGSRPAQDAFLRWVFANG